MPILAAPSSQPARMTRLLLIRHATTADNGLRLSGRKAGVSLDEQGRLQAQSLAQRLVHVPIAAILASPLDRTLETAGPLSTLRGVPIEPCEDFLEIEFGSWTGRTFDELRDDGQFRRFNEFRSCAGAPSGELMLQAQLRMIAGLDRLRVRYPQRTVAVFTHCDMIRAAIAHYAGMPLDLIQRIGIDPASVSVVDLGEDWVRIVCVNDVGGAQLSA